MKIIDFSFKDASENWEIKNIKFNSLTLLVGASGVGKTTILRAVHALKEISEGESIRGVKWRVLFLINDKDKYLWEGEFENKLYKSSIVNSDDLQESKLKKEVLKLNNKIIAERKGSLIKFQNKETPKLSPTRSLINLFNQEEEIKVAYNSLQKIFLSDLFETQLIHSKTISQFIELKELSDKYKKLEDIRNLDEDILIKFYLCFENQKRVFDQIKAIYKAIFPFVEDIKFLPLDDKSNLPSLIKDVPFLQIKEFGLETWIRQERFSSGMYRTLFLLAKLFLYPEGTVILIDEFENSLGTNCINDVTEEIKNSERKLQFILTSHHPYIINSIPYKHWKIVTRKAGIIETIDTEKLKFGKTKHDAFTQVLNTPEFNEGINIQ